MKTPHLCSPVSPWRRVALATLAALALCGAAAAQDGVNVGRASPLRNLVSAEQVEGQAAQQYAQLLQQAAQQRALAPASNPQVQRLRAIAQRIVPFAPRWNPRAAQWKWEVNLIGSKQLNAFCMPGGKIAFYSGILDTLKLSDDEVAIIMGHEMAHALREHARERMGKQAATGAGASLLGALLGVGNLGQTAINMGANLLTLKFSREDESEADIVGLDLAARAGYDPRAGVVLWQKMALANKGAPPQWLSTHPAGNARIKDIEKTLPAVLPLYAQARGTTVAQLPPYKSNLAELQQAAAR